MPGSLLRARWIIRGQPSLSCLETGSNENWPEEESKDVVVCPLEVSNSYSIPAGGDKAMDKIQSWPSKNLTSPKRDESFPYLLLDDILRQQVRQLSSSPFCRQRSPRSGEDTYRAHHQCLSVGRSVEGTRRRRAEPEKDEHPSHETRRSTRAWWFYPRPPHPGSFLAGVRVTLGWVLGGGGDFCHRCVLNGRCQGGALGAENQQEPGQGAREAEAKKTRRG
ncbi:uncharacterized protein LOC106728513 isoform X2 [Camelus ferus]|uniref:Uncharacterized protein LOC106728513 isoform X2 n=1 Tax=Camelus ferus TaxID=419612 RepID=A0A8B8SDH6_CAMFR|nr:uncharacterized protein LOC106728513 isoform X2 [Camelus ferus]